MVLQVCGGRLEIGFSVHRALWRGRDRNFIYTENSGEATLSEKSSFIKVQLATVYEFSDFDRGAMREKMAIFKERNSVCRGTKNFMKIIFLNIANVDDIESL